MSNEITYEGTIDDPSRLPELEDLLMDYWFCCGGTVTLTYYLDSQNLSVTKRLIAIDFAGGHGLCLRISETGKIDPNYVYAKHDYASDCHEVFEILDDFSSDFRITDEWQDAFMPIETPQNNDGDETRSQPEQEQLQLPDESSDANEGPAYQSELIALSRAQRMFQYHNGTQRFGSEEPALADETSIDPDSEPAPTRADELIEAKRLRFVYQQRGNQVIEDLWAIRGNPERQASLLAGLVDSEAFEAFDAIEAENIDPIYDCGERGESRPLDERAQPALDCILMLMQAQPNNAKDDQLLQAAVKAAYDIAGGLAQSTRFEFIDHSIQACAITQLKRASRGAAMLDAATSEPSMQELVGEERHDFLKSTCESLQAAIVDLQESAWLFDET